MLDNYLIIHKSILPEYYEKVLEARRLLEQDPELSQPGHAPLRERVDALFRLNAAGFN